MFPKAGETSTREASADWQREEVQGFSARKILFG